MKTKHLTQLTWMIGMWPWLYLPHLHTQFLSHTTKQLLNLPKGNIYMSSATWSPSSLTAGTSETLIITEEKLLPGN